MCFLVAWLALAAVHSTARAAAFSVNPTRMELTANHRTDIINFTNHGDTPLRLQARVIAWRMPPEGPWQLTPSDDLIVTPELLEVAPGSVAQLRVGSLIDAAASEVSYRIVLNELPNPDDDAAAHTRQIRVLTEISLPVFLEPVGLTRIPDLRSASMARGVLRIGLGNDGSQRLDPQGISVSVLDSAGHIASTQMMMSHYVLAGATWTLSLTLPSEDCRRATSVSVVWPALSDVPITHTIATPGAAACANAAAH
jgi:fimbrial chaperone protein